MGKNSIEQHFQEMYPNWLQQTKRLCAITGRKDEAQDILQEVICSLLKSKSTAIEELCEKQEHHYKAIDCILMKALRLNIYSSSATYFRKYHTNIPPIDRNTLIEDLDIISDQSENDLIDEIEQALQVLNLSEIEKKVFTHYYLENKPLYELSNQMSYAKLSRTCKKIILQLKEEFKKRSRIYWSK